MVPAIDQSNVQEGSIRFPDDPCRVTGQTTGPILVLASARRRNLCFDRA